MVNFDPVDKTVLANEQVDSNGLSWRSGAKVEKRLLKQWYFKISEYRQELLDDLRLLEKNNAWPDRVLTMQKNWLGKSLGAQIKFGIASNSLCTHASIEVYTTRPDTIFGAQYIALSPTHQLVQSLAKLNPKLRVFLETVLDFPPGSKSAFELPDISAINPFASEESMPESIRAPIPVYVAPYVLEDYGTGAVMGVPGHDIRDNAFWKLNVPGKPVRFVIAKTHNEKAIVSSKAPFTSHGYLTNDNGPYSNLKSLEAIQKIIKFLEAKGLAFPAETWRLRDWLVSRQRYWGTPIPIVHCDHCGTVAVPENQLPVELPPLVEQKRFNMTGSFLKNSYDWISTNCPSCGGAAKRETDTMDTFVDSSWYYLRFLDPQNKNNFCSPELANTYMPVDIYVGGIEHATLHLLYARFIFKFLSKLYSKTARRDIGKEPFKILVAQGMVHGKTYSDPTSGRFLRPSEVNLQNLQKPIIISSGEMAKVSFEKMSKSKYNGADPSVCREIYGADALRAHILFQAPITEILEWDEVKISGVVRWLRRLYEYILSERETWIAASSIENNGSLCPKDLLVSISQKQELKNQVTDSQKDMSEQEKYINIKKNIVEITPNDLKSIKQYWRSVQNTLMKVKSSYNKTLTLNTIVSDLMSLTNTIIEFSSCRQEVEYPMNNNIPVRAMFTYWSIQILIKMMAPITPAFAEECWLILRGKNFTYSEKPMLSPMLSESVLSQKFPEADDSNEITAPDTQTCSVQINGRLKIVVEIPTPPQTMGITELEHWITNEILRTGEGKKKLVGKKISACSDWKENKESQNLPNLDVRTARKIIVIKKGKVVNYII